MARRKAPEAPESGGGALLEEDKQERSHVVAIPRAWLGGIIGLLTVPWLIVAGLYLWNARGTGDSAGGGGAAHATAGTSGPWGELLLTPVVISPPLEYVPTNWGPIEKPSWKFPGTNRQVVERFFASTGLDAGSVSRLMSSAREEPRISGLVVSPDFDFVKNLSPSVRAAIYLQLAFAPMNERHNTAYRHFGAAPEDWLGQSSISPMTFNLVKPYIYSHGEFLYFADIDLVRMQLEDPQELQRLAKGLLRESTFLVQLRVPAQAGANSAQLDAIVEYWGRGGRRTDVRPIIESVAAGKGSSHIDISHLLPPQARLNLYRYPQITLRDMDKPALSNCFWTSLNFFRQEPDDRFLDAAYAVETLKKDYFLVHDQFQLGDVALFADSAGNYFHAAVYLAADLYYGKNGTSTLSPWTIVPLSRLRGYYPEYADDWTVTHYRRKGL